MVFEEIYGILLTERIKTRFYQPLDRCKSSLCLHSVNKWSLCYLGFGMRTPQCSNQNNWYRSSRCHWGVSSVTMEMILLMWQEMCLFCLTSSLLLLCPAVTWHRLISGSGLNAAMVCMMQNGTKWWYRHFNTSKSSFFSNTTSLVLVEFHVDIRLEAFTSAKSVKATSPLFLSVFLLWQNLKVLHHVVATFILDLWNVK